MSNVPMTRPEEMLAEHRATCFRASTFLELDDGRTLHATGTEFRCSEDGGITWSQPFERRDANGDPVGGPCTCLTQLSEKGIGLAAMRRPEERRPGLTAGYHMVFWRSVDGGETWEAPVRISPPGLVSHALRDTLLRTSSGRLIQPVYLSMGQSSGPNDTTPPTPGALLKGQWVPISGHFFDPRFSAVYVCYSDDDGRTWRTNSDGELIILLDWNATYSYVNEPSVAEVAPGRLLMTLRNGLGRLFQAWSEDDGDTWTRPQPTSLAASTAPAQIRTLPGTGHLLIVWSQENEADIKRGYRRTRLSSAISRNGGSIWEFFQNVESIHEETRVEPAPIRPARPAEQYFNPGLPAPEREAEYCLPVEVHGGWSYPSVLAMEDRVLISYKYNLLEEHPTLAQMIPKDYGGKLKVLPLSWFYGGKEPADHPSLEKSYEPARGRGPEWGRHDMAKEPR